MSTRKIKEFFEPGLLIVIGMGNDSTGGANCRTLTASDAGGFRKRLAESGKGICRLVAGKRFHKNFARGIKELFFTLGGENYITVIGLKQGCVLGFGNVFSNVAALVTLFGNKLLTLTGCF